MQNQDLAIVKNFAIECKENNDISVLQKIQENIKSQFEPCYKTLMTQIETNDLDNFKNNWMLFENYSKHLSDQFLFIQQNTYEINVAVQYKHNQVTKKLNQFQSEDSILLQKQNPKKQKNRFEGFLEDVKFIKNLKKLNILQQDGDQTSEEITKFRLYCEK